MQQLRTLLNYAAAAADDDDAIHLDSWYAVVYHFPEQQ